jgi:hypothetical protein
LRVPRRPGLGNNSQGRRHGDFAGEGGVGDFDDDANFGGGGVTGGEVFARADDDREVGLGDAVFEGDGRLHWQGMLAVDEAAERLGGGIEDELVRRIRWLGAVEKSLQKLDPVLRSEDARLDPLLVLIDAERIERRRRQRGRGWVDQLVMTFERVYPRDEIGGMKSS